MKKYYAKVISDDFRWKNEGDLDVYLASDVDAFMTAAGLTNWATQAARIAELERDAARYRFLRDQNIEGDSFPRPGIFIGRTMPDEVLTEEDADAEIDAALALMVRASP